MSFSARNDPRRRILIHVLGLSLLLACGRQAAESDPIRIGSIAPFSEPFADQVGSFVR